MSEIDDLRSQNKELKRLLENALDLLEKSKAFLASQTKSPAAAKIPSKKKAGKPRKKSKQDSAP